jgi:hypothetical protein
MMKGKMKKFKSYVFLIVLVASAMAAQSCSLDDDDCNNSAAGANALVTVKHNSEGVFYLQLDDSITVQPLNMSKSPFGDKEVRALANIRMTGDKSNGFSRCAYVNWIDSIRTKSMAANRGAENEKVYGSDPVEILNEWVTIAEDGYLTLSFRTEWGDNRTHYVNLVTGTNLSDPYELYFYHNANGDSGSKYGTGIVAFRLDKLPDTNGKTVDLKLKWKSFSGEKSAVFKYCTRKSTAATSGVPVASSYMICK